MLDKKYKYLARDNYGDLYVHEDKPKKSRMFLDSEDSFWRGEVYCDLSAFNHHFQFIQWNDEEPWLITDIINKCGTKFE